MTTIEKKTIYNALATYADVMARYEDECRKLGEIDGEIDARQEKEAAKAVMELWRDIIQAPSGTVTI